MVTVDESGGDDNLSVDKGFEMVAAHTAGGSGDLFFGVPSTLKQALDHEDSEYWKAAILDDHSRLSIMRRCFRYLVLLC